LLRVVNSLKRVRFLEEARERSDELMAKKAPGASATSTGFDHALFRVASDPLIFPIQGIPAGLQNQG